MSPRSLAVAVFVLASAGFAADPPKGKAKPKDQKMEKLDLGLGNFHELPKGADLEKAKPKETNDSPTVQPTSVQYTVVRVVHGKSFTRTAAGAQASTPFDAVQLSPSMMTDKFSTVVRVKCPQKLNAGIEVAVLDPRGDTVMEAPGNLNFRGLKSDELEWTVDWDPSPVRAAGDYKFQVKVNGEIVGTYPLKMIEAPPPAPKK